MKIFLTGAKNSLSKSWDNPQSNASDSLGGYVSSSPVPNAALNTLFDLISTYTLEKRQKETMAIGLINLFDYAVTEIGIKVISDQDSQASYKVAVAKLTKDYCMESIANRFQEPVDAEFHSATFKKANTILEIYNPSSDGEELGFFPFNVTCLVSGGGYDATWKAIRDAFEDNETYTVKRIAENKILFERRDDLEVDEECWLAASDNFDGEFSGNLKNEGEPLFLGSLDQKEGYGIWIQREIKKNKYLDNDTLLKNHLEGLEKPEAEEVSIVITYNLQETR